MNVSEEEGQDQAADWISRIASTPSAVQQLSQAFLPSLLSNLEEVAARSRGTVPSQGTSSESGQPQTGLPIQSAVNSGSNRGIPGTTWHGQGHSMSYQNAPYPMVDLHSSSAAHTQYPGNAAPSHLPMGHAVPGCHAMGNAAPQFLGDPASCGKAPPK